MRLPRTLIFKKYEIKIIPKYRTKLRKMSINYSHEETENMCTMIGVIIPLTVGIVEENICKEIASYFNGADNSIYLTTTKNVVDQKG